MNEQQLCCATLHETIRLSQKKFKLSQKLNILSSNPPKRIYNHKTEFDKFASDQKYKKNSLEHKSRVIESINRIRSLTKESITQPKKDSSLSTLSLAQIQIQNSIIKHRMENIKYKTIFNSRIISRNPSKVENTIEPLSAQDISTETQINFARKIPNYDNFLNKQINSYNQMEIPTISGIRTRNQTLNSPSDSFQYNLNLIPDKTSTSIVNSTTIPEIKITVPVANKEEIQGLDSIDLDSLKQYQDEKIEIIPEFFTLGEQKSITHPNETKNKKILQYYINNLNRLNIIGNTITKCIEMLNASNNVWIIPLTLVHKRLVQLKYKLFLHLKKSTNKFELEDWSIFLNSQEYLELLDELNMENKSDVQQLDNMLENARKQSLILPSSQKIKIVPLLNSNMKDHIKDIVFVYLYSQILARVQQIHQMGKSGHDVSKWIEIKTQDPPKNNDWLYLIILIQRSLIELESGTYRSNNNSFDYKRFQSQISTQDQKELMEIMLEQKIQVELLKKKYEEDYEI